MPGDPVGVAALDDDDPPDDDEPPDCPLDPEEPVVGPADELAEPPVVEVLEGVLPDDVDPVSDADAGVVLVSAGAGDALPDPPLTDTAAVAVACWKLGSPL